LLEQYRNGDPAATAEVQQFERSADPSSFALSDAQRILARAYGFESWPKLKAFVDGANIAKFIEAVQTGDMPQVRMLLKARPELIDMDVSASNEHRGWPLRNAWNHEDDSVKRLLLERGAKPQPYMIAETHDINEAKRLLAADFTEELAHELLWSAADHGCPAIVELALPHLKWPASDPRWHWVLIQPIRGAGSNSLENEGHFRSMEVLLQHGIDLNVTRFGQTVLHFLAARHGRLEENDRVRFGSLLLDHGAKFDPRDELLKSTPLGWACRWGRKGLAQLLIERGSPVDEPDAEPWAQPRAWARKMKHDAVLAVIEGMERK
jgi:hypothetical protein